MPAPEYPSWVPDWFKENANYRDTRPFCWINKQAVRNPRMHKNRNGLPACGARVDVCALEYENTTSAAQPCKRCFPDEEA